MSHPKDSRPRKFVISSRRENDRIYCMSCEYNVRAAIHVKVSLKVCVTMCMYYITILHYAFASFLCSTFSLPLSVVDAISLSFFKLAISTIAAFTFFVRTLSLLSRSVQ